MLSVVLTIEGVQNINGILALVLIGSFALWVIWNFLAAIIVVQEKEQVIIERFGRFRKVLTSKNGIVGGLHLLIPFIDKPRLIPWRDLFMKKNYNSWSYEFKQKKSARVDMRDNVMDFKPQKIITRDNVEIDVHPMLLYRLVNPMRVAYETYDISHAVEKLLQTNLRAIIGDMGMDDTLASREEINRALKIKISTICRNWGLEVIQIELLEITPTSAVQNAMNRQLTAERLRRAEIVQADGYRLKIKMQAEGNCESKKAVSKGQGIAEATQARGVSEARKIVAQAEAEALGIIDEAVRDYGVSASQYIIALRYIDTLHMIASHATSRQIYFPYEADVVGALSQVKVT